MVNAGVCSSEQFDEFVQGFNQASPLFSFVDVGSGKEAADAKYRIVKWPGGPFLAGIALMICLRRRQQRSFGRVAEGWWRINSDQRFDMISKENAKASLR